MAAQRFFPSAEADIVPWLYNYAAKLPLHGPACGLAAGEIAATLADLQRYAWVLGTWNPALQRDALEATAYKNAVATGTGAAPLPVPSHTVFSGEPPPCPPGVLTRLFNQVQRIKMSAGYNEAIGRDLGIVPLANTAAHPVPEFTASAEQGPRGPRVRLDFTKHGHAGVLPECRVNGGDWLALGPVTRKPAYDERPPAVPGTPETRDYRLRWWDQDMANGEYSAVRTVLVGG